MNGAVASELNCTQRTIERIRRIWIEAGLHNGELLGGRQLRIYLLISTTRQRVSKKKAHFLALRAGIFSPAACLIRVAKTWIGKKMGVRRF